MKKLFVKPNKYALVDNEDFESLKTFNWWLDRHGYAGAQVYLRDGKRSSKRIAMHREILKASKNKEVDHINHNPLDNRKSNLRLVTRQQNHFNEKIRKNNTSGYKGVCWNKDRNKWMAYIHLDGKFKHLGLSIDIKNAILLRKTAEIKHHGEYAYNMI